MVFIRVLLEFFSAENSAENSSRMTLPERVLPRMISSSD